MAQDKSQTENSNQEVDLDEVELDVLVIAGNSGTLSGVSTFLSRRGWPTVVQSNFAKALEFIADKKPDFVLLSVNHPNPAVHKLPDLLKDSFDCIYVSFAENSDAISGSKVLQNKIEHKISGQASGPAIYRSLRKILEEKFNIGNTGPTNASSDGGVIIQKTAKSKTNPKSKQSQDTSGKASNRSNDNEVLSTGRYTMAKSQRRTFKDLTVSELGPAEKAERSAKQAKVMGMLKSSVDDVPGVESKSNSTVAKELKKMVGETLQRVCTPAALKMAVKHTMRIGVFPVDSREMPGYLVLAMALTEVEQTEVFKSVERAIINVFKNKSYHGQVEPGFWLNVPEVDFKKWSEKSAEFTVPFNHNGAEIVASFFSTGDSIPKIKDSHDEMVSVNLDNLSTDHPVNFKAYLRLKENQKYFLYLRNGRQLQREQKERLKKNNVGDFYMKSVDRENVRVFLAGVFLCENIHRSESDDDSGEGAA